MKRIASLQLTLLLMAALCIAQTGCSHSEKKPKALRINLYTEPPSLDPRTFTDSTSETVLLALFEGITRIEPDDKPHPALAQSIHLSPDHKTYTIKLRKAYWSNGDVVTANDFAYAWKSILDPQFPSSFSYKFFPIQNAKEIKAGKLPIEDLGVKVIDETTLQITLAHPTPYFEELLAFPSYFPINEKIASKNPNWAGEAGPDFVTNGPFRLASWDHESELNMVKNPTYWDAKSVRLAAIHMPMVNDTMTEYYMFEMGELDWVGSPVSNLSLDLLPTLLREGRVTLYPAAGVYYYKINTTHFPLGNKNIRQALAYAINREAIVQHITQGEQTPALGIVPPMPGWQTPQRLFEDHDISRAKQLFQQGLEELGISVQDFPHLTLSYNANREHEKIAEGICQQWREALGIETKLEKCDWKAYIAKVDRGDYDIGRMAWLADVYDPISFLGPYRDRDTSATAGTNATGWENPQYKKLLDAADLETDPTKRRALLQAAEALIVDEMPLIPIYYIKQGYMKKPYVHGVYTSALGSADYKYAWIE